MDLAIADWRETRASVPAPLSVGVGILVPKGEVHPRQGIGQVDQAIAVGQVVIVQGLNALQMLLKHGNQTVGKHGYTILPSFALSHDDGTPLKIEIFDA